MKWNLDIVRKTENCKSFFFSCRFVWPTIALMEQLFDVCLIHSIDAGKEKNGWIRMCSFSSHTHWALRIAFPGQPNEFNWIDCVQYLWHVNSVPSAHCAHTTLAYLFLIEILLCTNHDHGIYRIWSKMSICVDLFINNSMNCCAAPLSFSHRTFIDRQLVASQLIAARWHLTRVQFIAAFFSASIEATVRFYRRFSTIK